MHIRYDMQVEVGFEVYSFACPLFDFFVAEKEAMTSLSPDDPSELHDGFNCVLANASLGHPLLGVSALYEFPLLKWH